MALLFCDGFENRPALTTKWDYSDWASITTGDKRTGSQSICYPCLAHKILAPSGDSGVIGWAEKHGGAQTHTMYVPYGNPLVTATQVQFTVAINTVGALVVSAATELGRTANGAIRADQWNYIEVKFTLSQTVGTVAVKVNGATVLNLTGVDNCYQGSTTAWNGVSFNISSGPTYIDDVVVCDQSGAQNNDWMGECRVVNILPVTDAVAAGSNADFTCLTSTDHGAMVDEATPDDDTSYVYSSTFNHVDSWEFAALGYTGTIKGVQLDLLAKKTESGARALAGVTRPTSTNRVHATNHYLGMTNYLHYLAIWELNPDDSAAWEVADIDGAEFGVKVAV